MQCTITRVGWSTPKPALRAGGEATVTVCGVAVAMLSGSSWAPHSSIGRMVNVGTVSGSPFPPPGQGGGGLEFGEMIEHEGHHTVMQ